LPQRVQVRRALPKQNCLGELSAQILATRFLDLLQTCREWRLACWLDELLSVALGGNEGAAGGIQFVREIVAALSDKLFVDGDGLVEWWNCLVELVAPHQKFGEIASRGGQRL